MSAATPAVLAQFVHRVPDGVTLPAGTEVLLGPTRRRPDHWIGPRRLQSARAVTADGREYWTRVPVPEPVPSAPLTLAQIARRSVYFDELAEVVAELAERIEAQS